MNKKEDRAELFKQVLATLKALYAHREIFVSLIPPLELSFEIDREVLAQRLKESHIDERDFRREADRISSLLLAILQEAEEQYVKGTIERLELKDEKEAEDKKKKLLEELENVRKAFWNQHLKDRYDLKASSKAPSFVSIDWDIKLKTKDANLEKIRFPYATCRIDYQREFSASPFAILGGKTMDAVQINFSIDDIEYLIKVLSAIMLHLEEAEREVKK